MQCPSCEHSDVDSSFGDPPKCPECGVYYAKALAHKRRLIDSAAANSEPSSEEPVITGKISRGIAGARKAVEEGRLERSAHAEAGKARLDPAHAQPVVVVDLRMNFWSMVWFMVKWAIASIPAIIILAIFLSVAFGFFIGLSGAINGPPRL